MATEKQRYKCPECGNQTATKNGTFRNAQKYYCPCCRKHFIEKKNKYSKKTKRFLVALLNMIFDTNRHNFKIEKIISATKEEDFNIDDINIINMALKNGDSIKCYNPALLFCFDYDSNTIVTYKFDKRFLQNTSSCEIKILHDVKNSEGFKKELQNKAD